MATASYVSKWLEINGTPQEVEEHSGILYKKRKWQSI
jgi:hypothetical protein